METPECTRCKQPFSAETEQKTPKLLPCSHGVCLECLEKEEKEKEPTTIRNKFKKGAGSQKVECPECHRENSIPKGGVQQFPTNNALLDFMKHVNAFNQTVPCRTHSLPCVAFCVHCCVALCTQCPLTEHEPPHRLVNLHEKVGNIAELQDVGKEVEKEKEELQKVDDELQKRKREVLEHAQESKKDD